MKIAVVYTARRQPEPDQPPDLYTEGDDPKTISAVVDALSQQFEAVALEDDASLYDRLKEEKPSLVFNMAEGVTGEAREARVPALLELMGIPCTGSGPMPLAITLNKARAKEILRYHRIPTPRFAVALPGQARPLRKGRGVESLALPLMVKPLYEGSSKGLRDNSLAQSADELIARIAFIHGTYNQPALVEEFLSGREFTAGILGNGCDTRVLPLVEVDFSALPASANPIYSYEAKWVWDQPDNPLDIFQCPAPVERRLQRKIEETALAAYGVLGCRDWCRVDLRLDSRGEPNVLELNPLPGILPDPADNSCMPKAARAAGMDYGSLIREVALIAMKRHGLSFS